MEDILRKHEEGTALSGKERGLLSRAIGEAKRSEDEEQAQLLQRVLREQGKQEKKVQGNPGVDWLYRGSPDLHTSRDVRRAERYDRKRKGAERERKQEQAVEVFLETLQEMLAEKDAGKRERYRTFLKNTLHRRHIIKEKDIPESYYESQQAQARREGHGDVEIPEEQRQELAEVIQADQRSILDAWFDYLTSGDALYPMWVKYWAMKSVLSLAKYDKERKQFSKRDRTTVAPFPDLDREALAFVTDLVQKKVKRETIENPVQAGENPFAEEGKRVSDEEFMNIVNTLDFGKYYAFAIEHVTASNEMLFETITGQWVTYPQKSDHMPLVKSLQGHGTGWCTAGEETAKKQLEVGDFHVYYSDDLLGQPTIPRVAIRMDYNGIAEVRGVAPEQNFDLYITPVIQEKLTEFPDGEQYQQRVKDMQYITDIEERVNDGEDLTNECLRFLYEIDRKIESPGYEPDPRIAEILETRDNREDLAHLFSCRPDQISLTEKEALSGDIVYHYGNLDLSNLTEWPEGVQMPKHIEGNLDLSSITELPKGVQMPEYIGGNLDLSDLTELPEGVQIPKHIGGNLDLSSITELPKGVQMPKHIGGNLDLSSITELPKGVQMPKHIGGSLDLSDLTEWPEGVQMPEYIGGYLNLSDLTELPKGVQMPKHIGDGLWLSDLTEWPEGVQMPEYIGGNLDLSDLTEWPEGVQMPEYIGGSIDLNDLTELPEWVQMPKHIEGSLNLSSITEWPKEVQMPEYIEGGLILSNLTEWPEGVQMPKHIRGSLWLNENLKGHPSLSNIPENITIYFR